MGKRYLTYAIVILLTFSVIGCSSSYKEVKTLETPKEPYTKISFMVDSDTFWSANPEKKDNQVVVTEVARASEIITEEVNSYLDNALPNQEGGKGLKVQAVLETYDAGSRALRYFVGFGAGKGKIIYNVKLLDEQTNAVIGEFVAEGTLSMGIIGGDINVAYKKCAEAIINYLKEKGIIS